MRGFGFLIIAAFAAGLPVGAVALAEDSPVAAEIEASKASVTAIQLAEALSFNDFVIAAVPVEVRRKFEADVRNFPDWPEMEKEFPGFTALTIDTGIEATLEGTRRHIPILMRNLADILENGMSAEEIEAAYVFQTSEVGRKITRMNIQQLGSDQTSMPELTKAERRLKGVFNLSPAGVRLQALAPKLKAALVKWGKVVNAAEQKNVDAAVEKAATEFITQKVAEAEQAAQGEQ